MPNKLANEIKFVLSFFKRFSDRGCMYYAASLAFNSIFAIVPLILLGFALLSFFPTYKAGAEQLEHWVVNNFVASSANVIVHQIDTFVSHSRDRKSVV